MRNKSGARKRDKKGTADDAGKESTGFVDLVRSQSSVEVKRDSKGGVVFTVKAYADTVEDAENEAAEVFERLNDRFSTGG